MQFARAAPPVAWAEPHPLLQFAQQVTAVVEAEARKLRHDYFELISRAVQPAVWLIVFGRVFSGVRGIPTGGVSYTDFIAPGILAQGVLFVAVFFGLTLIWERDLGILHKFLASPAYRQALVTGKALSAGLRSIPQAVVIYLVALVMGAQLRFHPLSILAAIALITLGGAVFATLSLIIACLAKSRQRFMGINQLLLMPLFFASNAIYPLDLMPTWLRYISSINPLTYLVDGLRAVMLAPGHSVYGLALDVVVQVVLLIALLAGASRLYPKVVY
jgi:ABC-2 type transport system permease protein